ncbi:MAG: preprotein translocase subunit YajC [Clostridia bacterium]|nr:preprotein translocase subunit YajC [Clostridia bacterium]
MFNFGFLLDGAAQDPAPQSSATLWIYLAIFAGFGLVFFFSYRSRKKQEKADADMRDDLQVGDEVTTIGGIIGKVVSIKEETFVLETTKERTKIRFLKGAIRSVDVKASAVAQSIIKKKAEKEESSDASSSNAAN